MSSVSENNKRIAKNTLLLYVRMFISMAVALYTSRVVIQVLGVEDYGIYGVVGGFVAIFSFLTVSMATATSRFLTYELGTGDEDKLRKTFVMAFWEHVIIALLVIFLVEIIGVWFLNNKMVIPEERLFAANIVLQMSIASMVVSVLKVPFSASVISHEHMDAYAYIELIDVGLKLAIVFLLMAGGFDKLILYSILVFLVGFSMFITYFVYCHSKYKECRIRFEWHHSIFSSMMKFSGWDLYGNLSVAMRTQGVNVVLNLFFGPIVNAAAGIATQVQGAVMAFGSSITTAVKPQIIKYYAQEEYENMVLLLRNSVKLNYLILLLPTIPLAAELHFVLNVWLGIVPDWTVPFCLFTLLFNLYTSISGILVTGIHATGKNLLPNVINGTLYLLVIPFSYFAFRFGTPPWAAFAFNVVAVMLGMLSNVFVLHSYISVFSIRQFLLRDFVHLCVVLGLSALVSYVSVSLMEEGWLRLFVTIFLSSVVIIIYSYFFIVPKSLFKEFVGIMKNKISKKSSAINQ